jgi:hypothetical protein
VQEPAPFLSLHSAFAPQGDGLHGSRFSGSGGAEKKIIINIIQRRKHQFISNTRKKVKKMKALQY